LQYFTHRKVPPEIRIKGHTKKAHLQIFVVLFSLCPKYEHSVSKKTPPANQISEISCVSLLVTKPTHKM